MLKELDGLRAKIIQAATERGLLVFDGQPDISKLADITWEGDWLTYLDRASQAHATLLYLEEWRYASEEMIEEIVREEAGDFDFSDDETNSNEESGGGAAWLHARLKEAVAPWAAHIGEVYSVSNVWIKEGVAHYWSCETDWYAGYQEAIATTLMESKRIERDNRILRSQEVVLKLYEYATQMAHHPRFREATSEEKRVFMARQLFPDVPDGIDDLDNVQGAGFTSRTIARRAALIYWWDIEPTERVTIDERVRVLRAQGESIKNITAVLKISEAKVRAAINNAS